MGNLSSKLKKRSRSTSPCCLARNSVDSSRNGTAAVVPTPPRLPIGGSVGGVRGSVSSLLKIPTSSRNVHYQQSITVSRSSTLERRSKNGSSTNLTDERQNSHENGRCSKSGAPTVAIQRSRTKASFYNDKRRQTLASSAVAIESPYNNSQNYHYMVDDLFLSRRSCLSEPSTPIILNSRQKLTIVKSWHQWSYGYKYSHTSRENVGVKIYLKLFSKSQTYKVVYGFDPKIREDQFLINNKFIGFVKVLNNSLENAVQHLDSLLETVRKILLAVGASHSKLIPYGFKVNHLDGLGEAILECLLEAQGATHKHRDTATAWRIFVSWFVDVLKEGFQDSVRQNRRATLPVASWATAESSTPSSSTDDLKRAAAMVTSSNGQRLSFVVEKFV